MSAIRHGQPKTEVSIRAKDDLMIPSLSTNSKSSVYDTSEKDLARGIKRKRESQDVRSGKLLQKTIIIQPYPSSTIDTPFLLTPILLLPRSCLSLKYLEPIPASGSLSTRLFAGHIDALEDPGKQDELGLSVLISRLGAEKTLCAIELVRPGIYALCRLAKWVNINELRGSMGNIGHRPTLKWQMNASSEGKWWESATVDLPKSIVSGDIKRQKIEPDRSVIVSMRPSSEILGETVNVHAENDSSNSAGGIEGILGNTLEAQLSDNRPGRPIVEPGGPQDTLEMVVTHYLEALYLSKTSLAYFAKGPLSRARAAFNGEDPSRKPKDLAVALRSLILSLNVMDKKYRESLATLVQSLPAGGTVSEDEDDFAALKVIFDRKSRKKKMKPGKDGLYPPETQLVEKWWRIGDNAVDIGRDPDEWSKARLARLRTRETELQIILTLEVMALENYSAAHAEKEAKDAPHKQRTFDPGSNKKKPQNLSVLLDLLADRLCIWQSLNNEGTGEGTSASAMPKSNPEGLNIASSKKMEYSHLYDFCMEVIVPFFASRLPEECTVLNKKLGGPIAASPARPKLSSSSSSRKVPSKPGAAIKRSAPSSRTGLSRVSSDAIVSHSRPPRSLARSATESAIPGLKREKSETPLLNIPEFDTQAMLNNRRDVLKSRRFTQREVDLSALHPAAAEAKLKKKSANVEEELREAIAAIKKPNRQLALKDAGNASRVQVQATPKGQRFKDLTAQSASPISVERSPVMKRVIKGAGGGASVGIEETPPRGSKTIKFPGFGS